MSRIQMGSSATLITAASIPPRIWEQDKAMWRAWLDSLNAGIRTKQTYKGYIVDFTYEIEKSISQVTEQDILDYHTMLGEHSAASSAKARIRVIRAYWNFARAQVPGSMNAAELRKAMEAEEELEYHVTGKETDPGRQLPAPGWYPCTIEEMNNSGNAEINLVAPDKDLWITVLARNFPIAFRRKVAVR